jgi:mRNA interferase MazF
VRSIDNKRLVKRVGELPQEFISQIRENLSIVLDLE